MQTIMGVPFVINRYGIRGIYTFLIRYMIGRFTEPQRWVMNEHGAMAEFGIIFKFRYTDHTGTSKLCPFMKISP